MGRREKGKRDWKNLKRGTKNEAGPLSIRKKRTANSVKMGSKKSKRLNERS